MASLLLPGAAAPFMLADNNDAATVEQKISDALGTNTPIAVWVVLNGQPHVMHLRADRLAWFLVDPTDGPSLSADAAVS